MIKNFTFTLPDGPYLTTTENGQTVNCTYNGAKYLCLCVNNQTKMVRNVERTGETIAELDMDNQIEDGHFFVVLDASVNPLQAAYLTHDYTHEEIEDIEETLTDADGETFTFNEEKIILEAGDIIRASSTSPTNITATVSYMEV